MILCCILQEKVYHFRAEDIKKIFSAYSGPSPAVNQSRIRLDFSCFCKAYFLQIKMLWISQSQKDNYYMTPTYMKYLE